VKLDTFWHAKLSMANKFSDGGLVKVT